MKKIITIICSIFLLVIPTTSFALVWTTPSQDTVAWDRVPVPTIQAITYRIYMAEYQKLDTTILVGETEDIKYTISFELWGKYVVGVTTVLNSGQEDELESSINWSDTEEGTPSPFAYNVIFPPVNLRQRSN